ncbi:UbiD family decarboxylase [Vibrio lentus]|nr:UbiD family decarboxylase [Vibrio lentus]
METNPGKPFPVSVAFESRSRHDSWCCYTRSRYLIGIRVCAGLLRGSKTEVVKSISKFTEVPASAEIVMEGYIDPNEFADEGPYGDYHTGYYNEKEKSTRRCVYYYSCNHAREPSSITALILGRPPDEPAVLRCAK